MTAALPPYLQEQLLHPNDDRRPAWIASVVVSAIAIWICVPLRFLARHLSAKSYGSDDWVMLLALPFATAFIIDMSMAIQFGGGRHFVFLLQDPEKLTSYEKNTISSEMIYNPAIFLIKLSILLLYRRLFPNKKLHIALWSIGIFTAAFCICGIFVPVFQCTPVWKLWLPDTPGHCFDTTPALVLFGALNVVTDAVLVTLPIPLIWSLRTSWTSKMQLTGLFLTGSLVTVISIVRVIYMAKIDMQDPTWSETDAGIWSIAEVGTAVVAACLPTYRPLFEASKRKQTNTHHGSDFKVSSKKDKNKMGSFIGLNQIKVHTKINSQWTQVSETSEANDELV